MNLAGTEYPLMTNGEMLDKILASEYEMVGSIPSEEKFNYRHEFTQYLNLEKEKLYDVTYIMLSILTKHIHTLRAHPPLV